ncbi:5-hydroxytryptamine receptor 3A-like isoform X2 [Electrophorus electricus]|uniref:5-hydroxytryptamine receptor 3A-like isoform X2 n=1 Tax=Electrophorus electricus TaxID=8005 RepID=UPI0015CFA44C|nr:5-hydroxytryptamine receptor 3A-like isoform X2 [Electrophorus electricus]
MRNDMATSLLFSTTLNTWHSPASTGVVQALSNCSYLALQEYLGLDKNNIKMTSLRPVDHWQTSTLVFADLHVSSIVEVTEKAQIFSLQVFMEMSWVNEFTKWNPKDFCGITFMPVSKQILWIPDINIIENLKIEFSTLESPFLKMQSSGIVTVGQFYTITAACKMDLYQCPFDTQSCTLTLQSTLDSEELQIEPYSNDSMLHLGSKQLLQIQGEWDLLNINMSKTHLQASGKDWDQLTYTVTIKRRPLLYVIIFLLPVLYFLVLDVASYYIPNSRREKLSFKVSLLLANTVFPLILHDTLPSTANKIPLIGVYSSVIFTFMAISLLQTILVIFLRSRDTRAIPNLPGETMAVPAHPALYLSAERNESTSHSAADHSEESNSIHILKHICDELRTIRLYLSSMEIHQEPHPQPWTKLAERIEKAFFYIYVNSVLLFLQQISQGWFSRN